jgi:hypothetical protein
VGGCRWKTLVSRYGSSKLDIEFPTAAPCPWKSPTARFPHFHSAGDGFTHIKQEDKTKAHRPSGVPAEGIHERSSCRFSHHPFQDHLVLESISGFSIILRLENAPVLLAHDSLTSEHLLL